VQLITVLLGGAIRPTSRPAREGPNEMQMTIWQADIVSDGSCERFATIENFTEASRKLDH
jgi:hypothetical protein